MDTLHSIIKIAILTSALFAAPVFAGNAPNYTYLALGDSISFGYDPTVAPPISANYTGYPEILAADLNLVEVNASCPGQTSASFISGAPPDNGCEGGFKASGAMHAAYTGSQLAFAVSQLRANRNIKLVTLSIGGNDLLLLQNTCLATSDFVGCITLALSDPSEDSFLNTYGKNLAGILAAIRGTGYAGNLVLMEYAAPNTNPLFIQAITLLNSVMKAVAPGFGAGVADGFMAFQNYAGDPCAAGLLVPLPNGPTPCDVHPTFKGQQLLAGALINALNPPLDSNCIYTGTFRGNLTVTAGQNCLVESGAVTGNVMLNGGTLVLNNATISGNVQVQNGGAISVRPGTVIGGNLQIQNVPETVVAASQICRSTVNGNVTVQNNGIPAVIGSSSPLCGANVINGNLQVQNNTGSTVILNNTVTGNLQDQNNSGQTQVFSNSVTNNLQCDNNSRIAGAGNTAKPKQGQCATF
jgi:lysophospholipase L1-like esterase